MPIIHRAHAHAKRHFEKHYRTRYQERAHAVFALDGVLIATALFLLGLTCYFRWVYHPLRDDFRLRISIASEIVAGQESEIIVSVENVGKEALQNGQLTMHFPAQFLPTVSASTSAVALETLAPKAKNEEHIRGTFFGSPVDARVVAHFTAEGTDGRHDERLVSADLNWDRSLIETSFVTPDAVIPGQNIQFRLHVKNGSAFTLDNARVNLTWPDGFRLINATPPVYRNSVALGRLDAGEEADIDFNGRFGGAADLQRLAADMIGTINGHEFHLAETRSDMHLLAAGLQIRAAFKDTTSAYVLPGQEIPVIISYHNSGDQTLKNLTLDISKDARAIAGVRWETSAAVGDLAPNASGERTAYVRVPNVISQYVINPTLTVVPHGRFSLDNPKVENAEFSGEAASTKIAGAVNLRTVARFFTSEGDQIGRGPLPPRVGKTTRYWIFATLETGATEIQNGVAIFTLPDGVAWTGRATVTSGDDLALNGNRLTWRLDTTAAHAGLLAEAPSASFEVALTPTAAQVGTSPLLLAQAAYSGSDAWTGASLTSNQAGLTTQLPGDPAIAGRTTVKP